MISKKKKDRYAMRTCGCYFEIHRPHGKRRQRTLRERRTFAFCLHSFWVSLWTLESKVREGACFHFLMFVMNFLKGAVLICHSF